MHHVKIVPRRQLLIPPSCYPKLLSNLPRRDGLGLLGAALLGGGLALLAPEAQALFALEIGVRSVIGVCALGLGVRLALAARRRRREENRALDEILAEARRVGFYRVL
ncbi:hypothetical protein [Neomegalonema sp.]|uniref:hypothetical protein n=1 Tax=Neomegalonema sp. TaxID=2039713 RepID=UPI0026042733|nr:hypothetical protein [Neomegalonema sp.]MDD2869709.1 hypothetical protein [Neomegalonema sp.]